MASNVPVAIIGMSCRFAGDATDPQKLWQLCAEGRSAWSKIPADRFNLDAFYHPNGQKLDTLNVVGGHFLSEDVAFFDANFFNFTSDLAASHDPQFRLQLECTYEALESAGLSLQDIAGSNTSVFAGSFFRDYNDMVMRDPETLPRGLIFGIGAAMASNRLSHFYDLRGPSMTIDTGCSTTLTAFHQACQSLRSGESDMSIVGASNVILNPDNFMFMSASFLSEAGRSFAFDSRASGYGRGEGSVAVIIKRLDDALRDGDPIRAVIRATGANQDGKTETISTPSQEAQEKLIRECYIKAGLDPAETTYFEAHGTGTPTGDPIETRAIASVFRDTRTLDRPLVIGSVKTNIGHTESASGLASVIKVCMALENNQIPPSINFDQPNESIYLDEWKLKVPTQLEPWHGVNGIRRASVNNFGYGGANAHVIIEDYTSFETSQSVKSSGLVTKKLANGVNGHHVEPRSRVFMLSAKDEQTALLMASNLKEHLCKVEARDEEKFLDSLAYTLGQRRSIFPWISSRPAHSISSLIIALDAAKLKPTRASERPKIGFVFTGQGAQWHAMGRELIEAYPVFKSCILEAEAFLKEFGAKWSLIAELTRDAETTNVNELAFSTPLCAVVQISLVRLLETWGVTPVAITSHSSGEIAAAYAAGALSLRSAMAIVFARGQMAGRIIPGINDRRGGMIATGIGAEALEKYISLVISGQVMVACLNSPHSTTASGDILAIEELEQLLKADNIFARRLKIDAAYHSHHMQALSPTYLAWLQELIKSDGQLKENVIYSSPTTGKRETSGEMISSPDHWVKSFASPVRFIEAFHNMCFEDPSSTTSNVDIVIEIGPHAALGGPIQEMASLPEFKGCKISYFPSLIRKSSAVVTMHNLACELISAGYPLNMNAINFPFGKHGVAVLHNLPKYPWNHQIRHWSEPRVNKAHRHRTNAAHDLLGSLVLGTNLITPSWRHLIRLSDKPWLRDHVVQSDIVYPGAGFVCMAIEASHQIAKGEERQILGYQLRDIEILLALVIPDSSEAVEVQVALNSCSDTTHTTGWKEFHIYSVSGESKWIEHCRGFIQVVTATADGDQAKWSYPIPPSSLPAVQLESFPNFRKIMNPKDVYAAMQSTEVHHGPIFQNLKSIKFHGQKSMAAFSIADTAATMPYHHQSDHVVHPTTLDSLFQAAYAGYTALPQANMSASFVPRLIKGLYVAHNIPRDAGHNFKAYCTVNSASSDGFDAGIIVVNDSDHNIKTNPILKIDSYITQSLGNVTSNQMDAYDELATVKWAPDISFATPAHLRQQLYTITDSTLVEIKADLIRLCSYFITDALIKLTRADVAQLQLHHKKFYVWMKLQAMLLSQRALDKKVLGSINGDAEGKTDLIKRANAASANGKMVCRLGPHIASIMRREVTALELMLEDDLMTKYHAEALGRHHSHRQIAHLVELIAHKNPKAKILEIGGGDHAVTECVLNVLRTDAGPLAACYDITNTLPESVEANKVTFGDRSDLVSCKTLDIEHDTAKQGFETNTYDLIIASRLAHSVKNLGRAVANIRKLLKPGGSLLLMETTRVPLDMFLTFGLLPAWWMSEEKERKLSPSLSIDMWDHILLSNQFCGVKAEFHDNENEEFYSSSVIWSIATNPDHPKYDSEVLIVTVTPSPPEPWLEEVKESLSRATAGRPVTAQPLESASFDGKVCIFLGEIEQAILNDPSPAQFESIKNMCTKAKGILWVTRGGAINYENVHASLSQGFLRTARKEYAGKRMITLDLDGETNPWDTNTVSILVGLFTKVFDFSPENVVKDFEFAERGGVVHIPRYYKDAARNNIFFPDPKKHAVAKLEPFQQDGRPLRLSIGKLGLFDTLSFTNNPNASSDLGHSSLEIQPRAFGVNLRDVMVAMGMNETEYMGLECSGIIKRVGPGAAAQGFKVGDRIAALLRGHYASSVRVDWTSCVHIPDSLSFEEAASFPHSYSAAYICLHNMARIQNGESVLIHAAAGAFGQAAIVLAKHTGAEIFVTVGTQEKIDFMINEYGIQPNHIFSSRDASFAPGILARTGGRGVDVVLNSLAGALLQESFNCVAQFGRFIEVGKRDLELNRSLHMRAFTRNISFSSMDLLQLEEHKGHEINRVLNSIMILFEQGLIHPPKPIMVHSLSDIEKTFRMVQSGKYIGKNVISVKPDDLVPVLPCAPSLKLRPDASYLVVGGLGGIGLSVCDWMVDRGAKNLIILSRSANAREKSRPFLDEMEKAGCKIYAVGCDISVESELKEALAACARDMPPIRGVIQGAMVLQDSVLEQMTVDQYRSAIRPKVQGSWNLHQLFDNNDIDFFVMLSSLSGVVGIASQCNYAAGGTFQDALARYRTTRGLHGVAIDIGVVQGVGVVAQSEEIADSLRRSGFKSLPERHVLRAIECAITTSPPPQTQMLLGLAGMDWEAACLMGDERFAALRSHEPAANSQAASKSGPGGLGGLIAAASTLDEAVEAVVPSITSKLGEIFMLTDDEIDASKAPRDYGVDSLSAVELRNMLALRAGAEISIFDIMQSRSVTALSVTVATKSSYINPSLLSR